MVENHAHTGQAARGDAAGGQKQRVGNAADHTAYHDHEIREKHFFFPVFKLLKHGLVLTFISL